MEALIDLRVNTATVTPAAIQLVHTKLSHRFPTLEERRLFKAAITVEPGKLPEPHAADEGLHGYFLKSADEREVAQFRVDGFTYNRLHPYPSWEDLLPRAIEAWNAYVEATSPQVVTRVALRCINRLKLPLSADVLERHLVSPPIPPPGGPQWTVSFLTRVESEDPESGIRCTVTQASESIEESALSVILDIDTFLIRDFEPRDPVIAEALAKLRELKNDVFFSSLTEEAVRLFE